MIPNHLNTSDPSAAGFKGLSVSLMEQLGRFSFLLKLIFYLLRRSSDLAGIKPGRTFRSPRQYLNDWSHSLITFIRYFSELVPIFMGNHSLCRISGFEIEDQPLTLSTLEFLLMDQVDFRYPLLGGVEPVMITSLLSS